LIHIGMYTFPFDTCEVPQRDVLVAQPVSSLLVLLSVAVLTSALLRAKSFPVRGLIASFLAFEVFHFLSHAVHVPGKSQVLVIHVLAYVVNAFYFYALWRFTRRAPSNFLVALVCGLVVVDVYAVLSLPFMYYFSTQVLLFVLLSFYYSKEVVVLQECAVPLVSGVAVLTLLLHNETVNCTTMLRFGRFPYHALVEAAALGVVWVLCKVFLSVDL